MTRKIKIRVPGSTSNLGAGFDTLGLAIDLHLHVSFCFNAGGTRIISAAGEGAAEIAHAENHLILQTFYRACREARQPAPEVALQIDNQIPLKRGLGSSGAAIIAGLLAAKIYLKNAWPEQHLLDLACTLEGHPENASASLLGGLTVNGVENGRVLRERFEPPEKWAAACFIPDLEIATEEARRVLPQALTRQEVVANVQSAALMVAAFAHANPALLAFAAKDYLHQPYRKSLIPGFEAMLAAAMNSGAYCAFLSGSGSTLLAICEDKLALEIAHKMAQPASQHGLTGRPRALAFSAQGASWEEDRGS
jgi:homoserine kinase